MTAAKSVLAISEKFYERSLVLLVGNKAEGRVSKLVLQENKARQIF